MTLTASGSAACHSACTRPTHRGFCCALASRSPMVMLPAMKARSAFMSGLALRGLLPRGLAGRWVPRGLCPRGELSRALPGEAAAGMPKNTRCGCFGGCTYARIARWCAMVRRLLERSIGRRLTLETHGATPLSSLSSVSSFVMCEIEPRRGARRRRQCFRPSCSSRGLHPWARYRPPCRRCLPFRPRHRPTFSPPPSARKTPSRPHHRTSLYLPRRLKR